MSTKQNQYFMYGILMSYDWSKAWEKKTGKNFHETFDEFMNDDSYSELVRHKDGIFCLFDGRDGEYIIIGRVLNKTSCDEPFLGDEAPLKIPDLNEYERTIIEQTVHRHFKLKGSFGFYFVTHYT